MANLRVGVLEILNGAVLNGRRTERIYNASLRRQYASLMPQAVSVWCRQLGHEVHYATYYGQRDPKSLLPDALDIVFLASDTQSSAVTYALAKLYRREKTLTVVGGPHAKAFPLDCLRFFDLVVRECDKILIEDILRGTFEPGTIITSGRPLTELPSVEERLPEIRIAHFDKRGQPTWLTIISLLASVGCPYRCDFCIDWNTPYVMLPREQLEADLRYLSEHFPQVPVAYHDPNFGVKLDQVLDVIETIPEASRNRYIMESSLAILRRSRLPRLEETNCIYVAPGVESWADYSNKAGVGNTTGQEKLRQVVDHFEELHEHVPGLQANFILGTDVDEGDEPVELTIDFIRRLPFVWPTMNIPTPFGGTPLHEEYLAEGRILKSMPFSFYYMPHLVVRPKNYHPIEYYEKLIRLHAAASSGKMLLRRVASARTNGFRSLHALRTMAMRNELRKQRRILKWLEGDSQFRAFHEGTTEELPAYYRQRHAEMLGPYAALISEADMQPVLDPLPAEEPERLRKAS